MEGIQIKALQKKDYNKVIQYAIKGMHFEWYIKNKLVLNLYGRYFLYLELLRATQVFAAYLGDELVGVLLCEIKGEEKVCPSFWKSCYVKFIDFMQNTFVKDGVGPYDEANKAMLNNYKKSHAPDGELIFLAANPDSKIKGIGTLLLRELEKIAAGKEIYLYTDTGCTYQFYEHRGFTRVGEQDVSLTIGENKVDITCLLYSKLLGNE